MTATPAWYCQPARARATSWHTCARKPCRTGQKRRFLCLTHVKELIDQNAQKLRQVWPNAPLGIYSAGLGRRDLDSITFAGIQSVRKKAHQIGHVDLVIVDECHLISHKAEGGYRNLINDLQEINPSIRVIGLTATPYRMGHGYITDGNALFDGMVEPVTIAELVADGYLAPLRSKVTGSNLDVTGVHKRGGEYIEKELQAAVDTADMNKSIVQEVISLAGDRKAWLFFCSGVEHAYHVRDELRERGIVAETVTGNTTLSERDAILGAYKRGEIKAITNANVLTTGFDYPDIDLIAMLAPHNVARLVRPDGRSRHETEKPHRSLPGVRLCWCCFSAWPDHLCSTAQRIKGTKRRVRGAR